MFHLASKKRGRLTGRPPSCAWHLCRACARSNHAASADQRGVVANIGTECRRRRTCVLSGQQHPRCIEGGGIGISGAYEMRFPIAGDHCSIKRRKWFVLRATQTRVRPTVVGVRQESSPEPAALPPPARPFYGSQNPPHRCPTCLPQRRGLEHINPRPARFPSQEQLRRRSYEPATRGGASTPFCLEANTR